MPQRAKYHVHRATSKVMMLWIFTVVVLCVLYNVYCEQSDFFRFGPSSRLEFFGIKIHTWGRYTCCVGFLVLTQALKVFADETISPFIINEIMQNSPGETTIADNFTYMELQRLCQSYYVFSGIAKLVTVFVSLTRIDLIMSILITDVFISVYTTDRFLKIKGLEFATTERVDRFVYQTI